MDNRIIHRWYNIWYIYLSLNIFVQLESENSPFQLAYIVLYIYIYHNYHIVPFELPDRFFVLWNAILPFDFLYPVTHPIYTHIFTHRFLDFLRGLHAILSRAANATIFSCVFVTGFAIYRFFIVFSWSVPSSYVYVDKIEDPALKVLSLLFHLYYYHSFHFLLFSFHLVFIFLWYFSFIFFFLPLFYLLFLVSSLFILFY